MLSPPQAAQKAQGSKRGGGGNAKFKTSKSEFGEWRPYLDKRKRGIFYYNRVSRVSQFEIPEVGAILFHSILFYSILFYSILPQPRLARLAVRDPRGTSVQ